MNDINIKRAPSMWAVVPFYATAAVAFLAMCVMLFFSVDALGSHYFQPKLLAVVHTAALGWGTMVIFGATYQLLPVIFEADLYSTKLAIASWIFLLPGVACLVHSFWVFDVGLPMQTGGILIFLAVVLFVWNVIFTAQGSDKYSIQKNFIFTSSLWLLVTVTIGLLLVFNFSSMLFMNHLQILKLHAHAGLAGWFLLLIIGVGTKLLPMFLLGKSEKTAHLNFAFYLINFGLIAFLIDGYFFDVSYRSLIYAAAVAAGVAFFLLYMWDVFKNRLRKKLDFAMKQSMLALPMLGAAFLVVPFIISIPKAFFWTSIYGVLLLLGWISSLILGQTFKTLPFIVWNHRYKELSGKTKLPMPKHLYHESWIKWQFYGYLPALFLLITGILLNQQIILKTASAAFIAVALLFNINVFTILLRKPKLP